MNPLNKKPLLNSYLLLFSAPSRTELVEKLKDLSKKLPVNIALLEETLATAFNSIHRIALIVQDSTDLAKKLENAIKRLESSEKEHFNFANQIFYGQESKQKIALLFPGFGARHDTLMEELYLLPKIREWLDSLADKNRFFQNSILFPTSAKSSVTASNSFSQIIDSVLIMNLAVYKLINTYIRPFICDAMVGHSYGENAMLVASGMVKDCQPIFDLAQNIITAISKLHSTTLIQATDVAMLAVTAASRKKVEQLLTDSSISIALDNCPQQTILCGQRDRLEIVEKQLKDAGVVCFRIPDLTIPVHTSFFPLDVAALRDIYGKIKIAHTEIPIFSCITVEKFPEEEEKIKDLLISQWSQPVRFRETIEKLYNQGIRIFIEVGPGGHLTGFTKDILRGKDAVSIAANIEGKDPISQLYILFAQLFVRGYNIDLTNFIKDCEKSTVKSVSHRASTKNQEQLKILKELAAVLELDDTDLIDTQQGFFQMGMSSIQAIELVERLEKAFDCSLPQTLPFDYPNVDKLAKMLAGHQTPKTRANKTTSNTSHDQIAVIGIGCRFPGKVYNPNDFWQLLQQQKDAIITTNRWKVDDIAPYNYPHILEGGFLDQIDLFDAAFFGISPREAVTLDPQQRLLLEVAWEALENAAIDPLSLNGSNTGVFVGISNNDYAQRLTMQQRLAINGYLGTGNSHSTAAGRLSFILGATGPCLAVDTACSSSLVALHLATKSLKLQESDLAIVGGVNLIISPETSIYLSMAGAVSKDSRCKTFDIAANGYVRGEGCGIVILKRLTDALSSRDRIMAVIRGSAINHDGHTSGFTVPHGLSQQAVVRQALVDAAVLPSEISYIEAHGTGTSLGDPIEVHALGEVFKNRVNPILIGSVKTNIGHLEASAGIASLIKVVLQLQHRKIATSLHFHKPNPKIEWEKIPVTVCDKTREWESSKSLIAGVSSFGISGTNAHAIVQQAPTQTSSFSRSNHILTLSAKSESALNDITTSYLAFLANCKDINIANICYTSNVGRAHFQHRTAFVVNSKTEAIKELEKPRKAATLTKRLAFLFSGQGSQYPRMGQTLFESEPLFRHKINECSDILKPLLEISLQDLLFSDQSTLLNQTIYTQPALFAIEYALATLWQSWAVEPDILLGHSIGEYVAAVMAGVFDLQDGLKLVALRGKLMQSLPIGGSMLAIKATESEVKNILELHKLKLSIAAVNGKENIVVSGQEKDIFEVEKVFSSRALTCKRLKVSHAFHSFLMEPILEEFYQLASEIEYKEPQIPLVSNLTGKIASKEIASARYWTEQLRQTVRFGDGLETLINLGVDSFLEIGARPVLINIGQEERNSYLWLASLHPPVDEIEQMLRSLSILYTRGAEVNWSRFHSNNQGLKVELPTYPFQRERFWLDQKDLRQPTEKRAKSLLGHRLTLPGNNNENRFESHISLPPYLTNYRVSGQNILPLAAFLAILQKAGLEFYSPNSFSIESFILHNPLVLDKNQGITIHTVINSSNNVCECQIFSCFSDTETPIWQLNAESKLKSREDFSYEKEPDGEVVAHFTGEQFYTLCQRIGLEYGADFQVIKDFNLESHRLFGRLKIENISDLSELIILDACFQTVGAVLFQNQAIYKIESIGKLSLNNLSTSEATVVCKTEKLNEDMVKAQVELLDSNSKLIAKIENIVCKKIGISVVSSVSEIVQELQDTDEERRKVRLSKYLSKILATILGCPRTQQLNYDTPLNQMGLDSLMALHLRNELQIDFSFDISVAKLTDNQTITILSQSILQHLFTERPTSAENSEWVEGEL
ncbi:MAG: acyltransferase domain-containing protein [Blastocatellia bacterium]|nr:acyltransferase domain-containing protein [Blastocatellia bacterium]